MSIGSVIRAFATVFPAELPDKTMIATVVLVARYRRPLWVWCGAVAAFTVHVVVAVTAGGLLGLLPGPVVDVIVATMFAAGAVVLWRAGRRGRTDADDDEFAVAAAPRAALLGSFALVVVAEWGDLTQLATAGLSASSGAPVGTGIGALAALASVAAIAATFGQRIVTRMPVSRINFVAAAVFAALSVWTIVDLLV